MIANRDDPNFTPTEKRLDMEDCVAGIRMVKYFDWRESSPTRVYGEDDTTQANTLVSVKAVPKEPESNIPPTCAREIHSSWACRAVSLACSPDVIGLRNCFKEIGVKDEILSVPYFGYQEGADVGKRIPCREWQESLGKCVAERATELGERVTKRKEAEAAAEAAAAETAE